MPNPHPLMLLPILGTGLVCLLILLCESRRHRGRALPSLLTSVGRLLRGLLTKLTRVLDMLPEKLALLLLRLLRLLCRIVWALPELIVLGTRKGLLFPVRALRGHAARTEGRR